MADVKFGEVESSVNFMFVGFYYEDTLTLLFGIALNFSIDMISLRSLCARSLAFYNYTNARTDASEFGFRYEKCNSLIDG